MNDVIQRLRAAGYQVKNRRQWGARHLPVYAYRRRTMPVDLPVNFAFAHITVTSQDGDAGARLVEQIGFDRFGSGVSYQWLVDHETHCIYEGMPLDAKGTHTVNDKDVEGFPYNLNYFGHAVAFMAMPGDEFCRECEELYAAILAAEKIEGHMRDSARYLPHSMFAAKDCPTDAVRDALPRIQKLANRMVRENLGDRTQIVDRRKDRRPRVSLSESRKAAERASWSTATPKAKDDVLLIVQALKAEGCANYRQWQEKLGYKGKDADGIPGKESLTKLGKKHGFRVVK